MISWGLGIDMRIAIGMAMLGIALAGCAGRAPIQMTEARWAAIPTCNVNAARFLTTNRLNHQAAAYGTCMADRQQWP